MRLSTDAERDEARAMATVRAALEAGAKARQDRDDDEGASRAWLDMIAKMTPDHRDHGR
jgi:hypothetical protein